MGEVMAWSGGYKTRGYQPESSGACGRGYFFNSDVQFRTRLTGAGVSSVDIVSTTNLLPSGETSKLSLNQVIFVWNRGRSKTTCSDPFNSFNSAAVSFPSGAT